MNVAKTKTLVHTLDLFVCNYVSVCMFTHLLWVCVCTHMCVFAGGCMYLCLRIYIRHTHNMSAKTHLMVLKRPEEFLRDRELVIS